MSAPVSNARKSLAPRSVARSTWAERLPRPVSMSATSMVGRLGEMTRSTSAPCAAKVRPQMGPASTRVISRTRMFSNGRLPGCSDNFGASPIRSGDLVPKLRRLAAVDAQIALAAKLDGGVAGIDRYVLRDAGPVAVQLGGGQRRRADADLCHLPDGKRRRQHRIGTGERDAIQ